MGTQCSCSILPADLNREHSERPIPIRKQVSMHGYPPALEKDKYGYKNYPQYLNQNSKFDYNESRVTHPESSDITGSA